MRVTSTTAVSLTKTETIDALLKHAGIELLEGQRATLKVHSEPFARYVIYIDTPREDK